MLALIHGISIAVHHSPVASYKLGLCLFVSSIALTVSAVITVFRVLQKKDTLHVTTTVIILGSVQLGAAVGLALSAVALPRRPDVLIDGRPVDRQRTVSALSRYTWSWVEPLLRLASVNQDLTLDDVPRGDHRLRSEDLQRAWDTSQPRATLLRSLVCRFRVRMALLYSVTVVRCVVSVVPFWAMHRVIGILENEGREGVHRIELPALVIIMALSNLIDGVGCPSSSTMRLWY